MADLRIFSYLPNPRLYKATIAARFSGAEIEIVGAKPGELAGWLWDYEARALSEDEKTESTRFARQAKTGFSGTLYKSDAFLQANPFGDVPTAFGAHGQVGLFESNSIMRAAARLGPRAPVLYGGDPLQQSRIDGFLDRTLIFARDVQRYLLSGATSVPEAVHEEMARSLASYLDAVERSLGVTKHLACDELSLADVAFACELCLLSNERGLEEALERSGLPALLPRIAGFPRVRAHLAQLAADPRFAEDLGRYFERLLQR